MPHALIEVRRRWSDVEEQALVEAVHQALVDAFRIPEDDRHVRLVVHKKHRFSHPASLAQPDLYTLISIDCFAGRSLDAKRALYQGIVDRLGTFGIPADHLTITLREIPAENWGIRGGKAAIDVDLGFKVDV